MRIGLIRMAVLEAFFRALVLSIPYRAIIETQSHAMRRQGRARPLRRKSLKGNEKGDDLESRAIDGLQMVLERRVIARNPGVVRQHRDSARVEKPGDFGRNRQSVRPYD